MGKSYPCKVCGRGVYGFDTICTWCWVRKHHGDLYLELRQILKED